MISLADLIRWANDNATKGGYIKTRDLSELAEAVDLSSPKVYRYEPECTGGELPQEPKYVIEVAGKIPDSCCDCPAANHESGYCQADKAGRSSDWRPFWCPAHELR